MFGITRKFLQRSKMFGITRVKNNDINPPMPESENVKMGVFLRHLRALTFCVFKMCSLNCMTLRNFQLFLCVDIVLFFFSFKSRLKLLGQKAFRRRSGSETCSWWSWFSTVDFICVLIIFGGLKLMLQPRLSFSIQFCRVICLFLWNQCQVLCFFFPQKIFHKLRHIQSVLEKTNARCFRTKRKQSICYFWRNPNPFR